MSSFITSVRSTAGEKIQRIPWKEYFKKQFIKIIGFIFIALLLIICMIFSQGINLETVTYSDPRYVTLIITSSVCFILVLLGFSKMILFDMGKEFGLRDEETGKMNYNHRFFLFAALSISFCSAIYLLLDVFLYNFRDYNVYLELLPVLLMRWILDTLQLDIPGLTDISGNEFYQTTRNIYFDAFFLIIVVFSVLVFLSVLTSYGRNRLKKRFKKEEVDEEEENRRLYKILAWIAIPPLILYLLAPLSISSTGPFIDVIILGLTVWWVYQILKTIFKILWRGIKVTTFITSVNALLLIPLILVLWGLPVLLWTGWDIIEALREGAFSANLGELIQFGLERLLNERITDITSMIELDFVIITAIATFIVGFAEGFALLAIASALYRGVEIARTGHIIVQSPPRVIVFSKYFAMLCLYLGIWWNSLVSLWTLLVEELNFSLPPIPIPSLVYLIYDNIILPLSDFLDILFPDLTFIKLIPFLLLPLYFILAGSFKFLSITIVTPRVKENLSYFFLLVSTAFVLIVTNILGDIYDLGFEDAPFRLVQSIITLAVDVFEYVESFAFYCGFIFGFIWLVRQIFKSDKTAVEQPPIKEDKDETKLVEIKEEAEPVKENEIAEESLQYNLGLKESV